MCLFSNDVSCSIVTSLKSISHQQMKNSYCSTLKQKTLRSSPTLSLVTIYQSIRRHVPQGCNITQQSDSLLYTSRICIVDTSLTQLTFEKYNKQCTYDVTLRRVRATIVVVAKAISIEYCNCVSADLKIQRAMRMRRIVICGPSRSTTYFSTLSRKRNDFRKKKKSLKTNMCFDFLYTFCLKHFLF